MRAAYISRASKVINCNRSSSLSGASVSSWAAGHVVVQASSGQLDHYPLLGVIVAGAMLVSAAMLYQVYRLVHHKASRLPG